MKLWLSIVVLAPWLYIGSLAAGNCKVDLQSYGLQTACGLAFVDVNGVRVFSSSSCTGDRVRGITTMIIDEDDCSIWDVRTWDTHVSTTAASDLSEYFKYLFDKVVISVCFDSITDLPNVDALAPAKQILRVIGANSDDIKLRGVFAFVTQSGQPEKTVFVKSVGPSTIRLSATINNDVDNWVTITKTA